MIYAINLFYSLICSYSFSRFYKVSKKNKYLTYCIYLIPVWSIWLIICGGQDGVGTDYHSYYEIFSNPYLLFTYYYKQEYLFAWIVEAINYFNLPPQTGFFIFYFIGFLIILKILSKLHHKTIFIFILLYLTYSTAFNNQLNGLRQYISLYIGTLAIMQLYSKNGVRYFIISIIFASLIHKSALFFIPFILLKYKYTKFSYKILLYILIGSVLFSLFGSYDWIWSKLDFIIPKQYMVYVGGSFDNPHGLSKMITKLIFVPFYYYSLRLLKIGELKEYDLYLYIVGFIGYSIRLFFMDNIILNRIGVSFILISIIPVYYLLRSLYLRKKYSVFILSCLFIISFYLSKVLIFPSQEYLYNSIYF